jgi:hypothetical protein
MGVPCVYFNKVAVPTPIIPYTKNNIINDKSILYRTPRIKGQIVEPIVPAARDVPDPRPAALEG